MIKNERAIEQDFLIAEYKYLSEEVKFSKRQQMMATWYILLLYGVIAKTHMNWVFTSESWFSPAIFSCTIVLIIGLGFNCACAKSQYNSNDKIRIIRKKFKLPYMEEKKKPKKCLWEKLKCRCIKPKPYCPDFISFLYYVIHSFAFVVTLFIIKGTIGVAREMQTYQIINMN